MLTEQYLALIRAALQYFAEELVPHGREAMQPYWDEPLLEDVTIEGVQRLRQQLHNCRLRYVVCHQTEEHVIDERLIAPLTIARQEAAALSGQLGTVLLIPGE